MLATNGWDVAWIIFCLYIIRRQTGNRKPGGESGQLPLVIDHGCDHTIVKLKMEAHYHSCR